jgi:hypothetical protein
MAACPTACCACSTTWPPGLPPGPQALLIRYARHAHDAGCGSYPGLRGLKRDLRTSHDTLQKWRDDLFLERRLIDRLSRVAPRGGDLIRLRCDQCQRAPMQARCGQCQRANLQHTETEWSDALQRARMQAQKRRALQAVPAATPVSTRSRPAAASPNGQRPGDGPPSPDPSRVVSKLPTRYPTPHQEGSTASHPVRSQPALVTVAAPGGAARTTSRDPPGASTGETFSHPMEAAGRYR